MAKQEPSLAQILIAVRESRAGSPRLLDNRPLETEDKKSLTALLHEKGEMNPTEIAKIVGVSRQMVHRY